jgi:hypothetical protein
MTDFYNWGGGTDTPDAITNAKLNQTTTHFTERIDAEAALSKVFSQDDSTTTGLTWGYFGGNSPTAADPTVIEDGTVALTASTINYVEELDGEVTVNTTGFTEGSWWVRQITTNGGGITSSIDARRLGGASSGGVTSIVEGDGIETSGTGAVTVGIADSGATDAKIGERVANPAEASPSLTGLYTQFLGWFTGALKAIKGTTNYYDAVPISLTDAKAHVDDTSPHSGHFDVDGSKPMTADFDGGGFKITNVANGVADDDVATVGQVNVVASGYKDIGNAKAMATGNATLSGLQTQDGVALGDGDTCFAPFQVTTSENGPWIVRAGAWERPADFDTGITTEAGTRIYIEFGTVHKRKSYTLATDGATVDTDPLEWLLTGQGSNVDPNSIDNVGTGAQIWKALSGTVNYLRSLVAGSNKLTITQGTDEVSIDVNEANLTLSNMGGTLPATKGGTGITSFAVGELIVATATNVLGKIAAWAGSGNGYLKSTNAGVVSFGAISVSDIPVMQGAGPGHAPGLVGDPGASLGPKRYWNDRGEFDIPGDVDSDLNIIQYPHALLEDATTGATVTADAGNTDAELIFDDVADTTGTLLNGDDEFTPYLVNLELVTPRSIVGMRITVAAVDNDAGLAKIGLAGNHTGDPEDNEAIAVDMDVSTTGHHAFYFPASDVFEHLSFNMYGTDNGSITITNIDFLYIADADLTVPGIQMLLQPQEMLDDEAPDNCVYYSMEALALVWKDFDGDIKVFSFES